MIVPLVLALVGLLALFLIIYLAKGHHATGGDLDALIELHGHIRAENSPDFGVFHKLASEVRADDLSGHVVLLGGIGWNSWLALAYLIVAGSWVAFTCYAWLLQNAPMSQVATYAFS